MATIALEGMHFYAYHGFYEEEQIIGNHYTVDVYITTPIARAAAADDLFSTVNYETVYFMCQSEMRRPTKLLETLAQSIADRLQGHFDHAQRVRVRVRKMNPPLGGRVDSAYVECEAGGGGDFEGLLGEGDFDF
jgi:dihydroneopterin aldolase